MAVTGGGRGVGSRRPLVTVLGASGLIGCALTRELARRPIRLRVVSRRDFALPSKPVAELEARTADLLEEGALAEAVAGSDAVVHLVAHMVGVTRWRLDEHDTVAERVNLGLVRDLVEALRDTRRPGARPVVLFAGTISQVGLASRPRLDGTEPDLPQGAYDRQKLAAERLLKHATREGVLRAVSLRMPTVFGHEPHSAAPDRGVVSTMIRRALADLPLTLWHDGTVLRDLIHVEDVARAFAAALDHAEELSGGHWLLGSGRGEHLGEVFTRIAAAVSDRTGRPPVPVVSVSPPDQAEVTDFHSYEIDCSRFRGVTGWWPRVPLQEGLERTVQTLAEQCRVPDGPARGGPVPGTRGA
ncbi:NAD-dependent epimerase/dehydratase family protein [Streptomyces pimonensis]|uniref:NAD-dependent epimerase/dehydratase family protein n=1 Tax=Streptomyces pimonensis TaxID=2860288 RepID=A0ABV4J6I0_9ACTN